MAQRAAMLLALAVTAGAACAATVYPSGPSVPENLLRIELRFDQPLQGPLAMTQVHLLAEDGSEIAGAFLDLPLPSADGRRLSLLLHPGRVKSGLGANLALGRALTAGSPVTLLVKDSSIGARVLKTWRVTPFDAAPPEPDRWTFQSPRTGSREALVLRLDRVLSSPAEAMIAVRGPDGARVEGTGRLEASETAWRFTPARPWRAGRHALVVHPELETPTGNRACGAFESVRASEAHCNAAALTRSFDLPP